MSDSSLFRAAALERLSSPEQLDALMQVTTAKAWIALTAGAALVAALGAWSVLGRLPTTVSGQGILVLRGGVTDVTSMGTGQIRTLEVEVDDRVEVGQVVARIAQPELLDLIAEAKVDLEEARAEVVTLERFGSADRRMQAIRLQESRQSTAAALAAARQRLRFLGERIDSQRKLQSKGLITGSVVQQTQRSLDTTEAEIAQLTLSARDLELSTLHTTKQAEAERRAAHVRVSDAERRVRSLEERLALNAEVKSPYRGRVVEVRARRGAMVATGGAVVALELEQGDRAQDELEAAVFLPLAEGKRVTPGMVVQLSPATVKKEEHGVLLGEVRAVDGFVASRQGMMRLLDNEALVSKLLASAGGTALGVRVRLRRDPETASGFAWSSVRGPSAKIESGTPCAVDIVVEKERPIAYVLPALAGVLDE